MSLSQYKSLGVINRTPNSFSDKGQSLHPVHFESQLASFLNDPSVIVDVGFESTAPMNSAITYEEELERFYTFLKASEKFSFDERFISFDTYKIKNFLVMSNEFKKIHPKSLIIFNDVGGILDDELKAALLNFKGEDFYYIYTFSHIPERELVLNHMEFVDETKDIIEQTVNAFNKATNWFKAIGMENQLILDPGFGFSKSFDQNWRLINSFATLESRAHDLGLPGNWLIGLSKKSFLQKALGEGRNIEELHSRSLQQIQEGSKLNLLFRVHDPQILCKKYVSRPFSL